MIAFLVFCQFLVAVQAISNYQIWCDGVCERDAVPSSTAPGVVLMGGGVSE